MRLIEEAPGELLGLRPTRYPRRVYVQGEGEFFHLAIPSVETLLGEVSMYLWSIFSTNYEGRGCSTIHPSPVGLVAFPSPLAKSNHIVQVVFTHVLCALFGQTLMQIFPADCFMDDRG